MPSTVEKRGIFVDFQPMSWDQVQRAMQFLLDQHARIEAIIESLSIKEARAAEEDARLKAMFGDVAGMIGGLSGLVGRLTEGVTDDVLDLRAAHQLHDEEMRNIHAAHRLHDEEMQRIQAAHEAAHREHVDEMKELRVLQRENSEQIRGLREQGKDTDARLNALIGTFERHLREDHGPRPS